MTHEIVGQGIHIYKCNNTVDKKNINVIGEELKKIYLKNKDMQVPGKWHKCSIRLLMIHYLV